MNKGLTMVKNEFLELLPPTIFFFIAIGLLMLTKRLVLKQYDIHVSDFAVVVVGALIIGKVVLIADHFSFVDKYPGKPLIYNVLWKTAYTSSRRVSCASPKRSFQRSSTPETSP